MLAQKNAKASFMSAMYVYLKECKLAFFAALIAAVIILGAGLNITITLIGSGVAGVCGAIVAAEIWPKYINWVCMKDPPIIIYFAVDDEWEAGEALSLQTSGSTNPFDVPFTGNIFLVEEIAELIYGCKGFQPCQGERWTSMVMQHYAAGHAVYSNAELLIGCHPEAYRSNKNAPMHLAHKVGANMRGTVWYHSFMGYARIDGRCRRVSRISNTTGRNLLYK